MKMGRMQIQRRRWMKKVSYMQRVMYYFARELCSKLVSSYHGIAGFPPLVQANKKERPDEVRGREHRLHEARGVEVPVPGELLPRHGPVELLCLAGWIGKWANNLEKFDNFVPNEGWWRVHWCEGEG